MTLPGRPVGPYQGVSEMSGENASGDQPGEAVDEDEYFLGGTSGPAIEPQTLHGVEKQRYPH